LFVPRLLACAVAAALLSAACSDPETRAAQEDHDPDLRQEDRQADRAHLRSRQERTHRHLDRHGRYEALRSRIDLNEDGKIDRWEYYDDKGGLTKVGFSRKQDGKVDAWGFSAPDGKLARVEISSAGDETKVDRWEYYDAADSYAQKKTLTTTARSTSGRRTKRARSRRRRWMRTETGSRTVG
jgi:hypothetical protein